MRLTSTHALEPGAVLGADVAGQHPTIPLLRAGVRVTPAFRDRLLAEGVTSVWVDDPFSDGIVPGPNVSPQVRREATKAVLDTFESARGNVLGGQRLGRERLNELTATLDSIAADLAEVGHAAAAMRNLASAHAYTHAHSVSVCTNGLLIANEHFRRHGWTDWLGKARHDRREQRHRALGMGLLLHDIGKAAVPVEILDKPGRLTADEWKIMQTHPEIGVSLLPSDAVSYQAIAVIRDHHERLDGSGYPARKEGERLHVFASIAAVADTYDAIVSERTYQPARPPHVACRVIEDGAGTLFDPDVVEAFKAIVHPYPVGEEIRLPDGRLGVVSEVDPCDRWRPTVRAYSTAGGIDEFTYEPEAERALAPA